MKDKELVTGEPGGGGLPLALSETQRDFILMRTPPQEIKRRKARGGGEVPYVEVGYVVEHLNKAFGWDWDFEVLKEHFNKDTDEVIVKGRLTVRTEYRNITKTQFGGSPVSRFAKGPMQGEIISLADDYKAAAADALKKCASLLGVAHDVYRGLAKNDRAVEPDKHWIDYPRVRRRFWAWARDDLALTDQDVYEALGVERIHDFPGTMAEARDKILDWIEERVAKAEAEREIEHATQEEDS